MATEWKSAVKFGIRVTPQIKNSVQTYVSDAVVEKYGNIIPENIQFLLSNGDIFDVVFLSLKRCFIGLRELLHRYRKHEIIHMFLEYIGGGQFLVYLFDVSAVEIEYPKNPVHVHRKDIDYDKITLPNVYNFRSVMKWQDHLSNSVLKFNSCDSTCRKFFIYMPDHHRFCFEKVAKLDDLDDSISGDWRDGTIISLHVGNKFWPVGVCRLGGIWYIVQGWKEFAQALSIGFNDLVVLSSTGNNFSFEVSHMKEYSCVATCVKKNLEAPSRFHKTVTPYLIEKGEMIIPRYFITKYGNELSEDVEVICSSGEVFKFLYIKSEFKLLGLDKFVHANNLQEGQTVVFWQTSTSTFCATIYDDNLLEVNV